MLVAPLLPFLPHAVVEHQDAGAVQAVNDGLGYARARAQHGDAGHRGQTFCQRLPFGGAHLLLRHRLAALRSSGLRPVFHDIHLAELLHMVLVVEVVPHMASNT
jgi:hypothetical protein